MRMLDVLLEIVRYIVMIHLVMCCEDKNYFLIFEYHKKKNAKSFLFQLLYKKMGKIYSSTI